MSGLSDGVSGPELPGVEAGCCCSHKAATARERGLLPPEVLGRAGERSMCSGRFVGARAKGFGEPSGEPRGEPRLRAVIAEV